MNNVDHPIFLESIRFIRSKLKHPQLSPIQQDILERLIHSSGDFSLETLLKFSPNACASGLSALNSGALILTDTAMAAAAINPMARKTLQSKVRNIFEWSSSRIIRNGFTKSELAMKESWLELTENIDKSFISPVVVIGSAPTALNALLALIEEGAKKPSLIIGMPVGFISVESSKNRLRNSHCSSIILEGSKGGASLAAATINAMLRFAYVNNSN